MSCFSGLLLKEAPVKLDLRHRRESEKIPWCYSGFSTHTFPANIRCDLDKSNLSRSFVPSLLKQVHLVLMNFSQSSRISICGMSFHLDGEVSKRLEDIIDRSPWKLPDSSRPSVVSVRELYVLLKGRPNRVELRHPDLFSAQHPWHNLYSNYVKQKYQQGRRCDITNALCEVWWVRDTRVETSVWVWNSDRAYTVKRTFFFEFLLVCPMPCGCLVREETCRV